MDIYLITQITIQYYHYLVAQLVPDLAIGGPIRGILSNFDMLLFNLIIYLLYFLLPFSPLTSSAPHNHHTVIHVYEAFFLFAQSLLHLFSPCLAVSLLSI